MTETRYQEENIREKRQEDGFRVMQGKREYVTYPENASVRVWYSDTPWRYDTHVHSAVEIVLTLEGTVDYTVNDTAYTVGKNDILIVPPEFPHALNMGEKSSRLLFLFETEVFAGLRDVMKAPSLFSRVFFLHGGTEVSSRIRALLTETADLYRERGALWNTAAYSCLLRVYAALAEAYLPDAPGSAKEPVRAMDREIIASSMAYINEHYRDDLSLDDVAEFAGFSRYYFSRSFKKQTGYFFKDYLCQKRLQVAKDLLIRTDQPMREIAVVSGFGSVATFNRVFREKCECTPTRYRELYGTV